MADQSEDSIRATLYSKLYFLPKELLEEKTIKQLKAMLNSTTCDICNRTFRGRFGKRVHMREVHNIDLPDLPVSDK